MMKRYTIKKGQDIPITGAAQKRLREVLLPTEVGIDPRDYHGVRPRLQVEVGSKITCGGTLFVDKDDETLRVCSPVSGEVVSIQRGARRVLTQIVVKADEEQRFESFRSYGDLLFKQLTAEKVMEHLCLTGLWPVIRQRPFSRIASTTRPPKAIYIQGFSSEPLAADSDFILEGQEALFQTGLNIIAKLSDAPMHLCVSAQAQSPVLLAAQGVNIHQFAGPHPAGNVSTHIAAINPINKGDVVWVIALQDVIRVARTFLEGRYCAQRMIALGGPSVTHPQYVKTVIGAPMAQLIDQDLSSLRCISGSVLTGKDVGARGYLGADDSQVTILSDEVKRHLFGWMSPGANLFSCSRAFLSAFLKTKKIKFDTDEHGSPRPIVAPGIYDRFTPLDIKVNFLVKAILADDLDEAEKLGLLEVAPEDFALASFVCPSKMDVGAIIKKGLVALEKELY